MAEETKTEHLLLPRCRWRDLAAKGQQPETQLNHYLKILADLGTNGKGRVRQIFANPTTFLHKSENLATLVSVIDALDWHDVGREGLGDVYEGLLQKNASETKAGAGQYFTPRPLIQSIVSLVKPHSGELIVDPALGTGGFLIAAHSYAKASAKRMKGQKSAKVFGVELVRDTHRLALMNAILHGISGELELGDSLASDGAAIPKSDVIITNPPFGSKKGAGRSMKEMPFRTSNKQLAFLQLIYGALKPGGRAAVILPDSVLFDDGVGTRIRQDLMDKCNLHTILRLPSGIFYAHGVKTNVLFFTRGLSDKGNTKKTWVYDLRTNMPAFGKRTPLARAHFQEFERSYGRKPDGTSTRTDTGRTGRFRCFSRVSIAERGDNLNLNWLKSEDSISANELLDPQEISLRIRDEIINALDEVEALSSLLEGEEGEV
jgi:type I restriction enzyme M protein